MQFLLMESPLSLSLSSVQFNWLYWHQVTHYIIAKASIWNSK